MILGRGEKGHIVTVDAAKILMVQTAVDTVCDTLHRGKVVAHRMFPFLLENAIYRYGQKANW